MKKKHLFYISGLALSLVACDPAIDDISMPGSAIKSSDELAKLINITHDDAEYFTYDAGDLYVKAFDEFGTLLGQGSKATIKAAPGSQALFKFVYTGADGTMVECTKDNLETITVWKEATKSWQLFTGNKEGEYSSSKTWKFGSPAWGNGGYNGGARWSNSLWWGAQVSDLPGQKNHSGGVEDPEGDANARMEFGPFNTKWDKDGNQTGKGAYTVELEDFDKDNASGYEYKGTLVSDNILFNWKINAGGLKVSNFKVLYYNTKEGEEALELMFNDPSAGDWGEGTFWYFVNANAKLPDPPAPVKWQSEELAIVTNIVKDKSGKDDGDTTAFKTGEKHKYTFNGLDKFNLTSDFVIITKKDDKFEKVNVGDIDFKVIAAFYKDTISIAAAEAYKTLSSNVDILFEVDDNGELKSTTMYLTEFDNFGNEELMLTSNPAKADTLVSNVVLNYKDVAVKHLATASVSGSRAVYTFENVVLAKQDEKTKEYEVYTISIMNTLHKYEYYSRVYSDITLLADSNFDVDDQGAITIKSKPTKIKISDDNEITVDKPVVDSPVTIIVEVNRLGDGSEMVYVTIK